MQQHQFLQMTINKKKASIKCISGRAKNKDDVKALQ